MAVDISNVHTDVSNNKVYIKSPDPTTSLIFFVILTTLFMYGKYTMVKVQEFNHICDGTKTLFHTTETNIITGGYILLLVIGNYFINLNVTKKICGNVQWKNTLIATLAPWVLIFGSMNLLLIQQPGWLSPFSNTLGYFAAKIGGLNNTLDKILPDNIGKSQGSVQKPGQRVSASKKKGPGLSASGEESAVSADSDESYGGSGSSASPVSSEIFDAIKHIYSDKSLLINEIPRKDFCKFVEGMETAGLFKERGTKDEYTKNILDLFNFILLKDIVAEYVWYMLSGILVTSVSYNYILNSSCKKNVKDMERRHDDYIAKQIAQHQNPKQHRVYTLDEM